MLLTFAILLASSNFGLGIQTSTHNTNNLRVEDTVLIRSLDGGDLFQIPNLNLIAVTSVADQNTIGNVFTVVQDTTSGGGVVFQMGGGRNIYAQQIGAYVKLKLDDMTAKAQWSTDVSNDCRGEPDQPYCRLKNGEDGCLKKLGSVAVKSQDCSNCNQDRCYWRFFNDNAWKMPVQPDCARVWCGLFVPPGFMGCASPMIQTSLPSWSETECSDQNGNLGNSYICLLPACNCDYTEWNKNCDDGYTPVSYTYGGSMPRVCVRCDYPWNPL